MAENITLAPITSFTNDSSAVATLNANNQLIETAFIKVLDRYGSAPNSMQAVLDMNSFNIINLPSPATVNSPARLVDVVSNPTIQVPPVGTSGSTVPLLNGNNTWSGTNNLTNTTTFTGSSVFNGTTTFNGPVTGLNVYFTASGGDDTAAFQAKVNALVNGQTLYIIGQLQLSDGIQISSKSNITIDGAGSGGFKATGVSTINVATFGTTMFSASSCTNVGFQNLIINGNGFTNNNIGLYLCTDCRIQNCWTTSGGAISSLFSLGSTRSIISGNIIKNTLIVGGGGGAIRMGNANVVEIEVDGICSDNQATQIQGTAYGFIGTGLRCTGNLSDTSGLSGGGSGFIFSGAIPPEGTQKRSVFANNIARSAAFHGFQFDVVSTGSPIESVIISNNLSESNTQAGFFLNAGRHFNVNNNVALNNTQGGIFVAECSNLVISGNVCFDSRSGGSRTQPFGIILESQVSTDSITDVVITGNLTHNNTTSGISLVVSGAGSMSNISIIGNNSNTNVNNGIGIINTSYTNVNIVGNLTHNNGISGIRCDTKSNNISGNYPEFFATVATLPVGFTGQRYTVNDATQAFTAGIGAIVVGGSSNIVPVFFDGTNWRIG